jgi:hypothetical protein
MLEERVIFCEVKEDGQDRGKGVCFLPVFFCLQADRSDFFDGAFSGCGSSSGSGF